MLRYIDNSKELDGARKKLENANIELKQILWEINDIASKYALSIDRVKDLDEVRNFQKEFTSESKTVILKSQDRCKRVRETIRNAYAGTEISDHDSGISFLLPKPLVESYLLLNQVEEKLEKYESICNINEILINDLLKGT